jgi:hypothetical protein
MTPNPTMANPTICSRIPSLDPALVVAPASEDFRQNARASDTKNPSANKQKAMNWVRLTGTANTRRS